MLSYQYFCDKCGKSWQFDTAPGMAAFGTSHWRTCESNRPTRQSVSTDCVGQSADLRTRIAAVLHSSVSVDYPTTWDESLVMADAVIAELGRRTCERCRIGVPLDGFPLPHDGSDVMRPYCWGCTNYIEWATS